MGGDQIDWVGGFEPPPRRRTKGDQLKEEGIRRAKEHADDVEPRWSDQAYEAVMNWVRQQPAGTTFVAFDVRERVRGVVPEPPNLRAWGSVFQRVIRSGAVKFAGHVISPDPVTHSCPVRQWRIVGSPQGRTRRQSPTD